MTADPEDTKYSVPDGHWERYEDDRTDPESPARVKTLEVEVILTTDPDAEMGYGREKYTAHIVNDDGGLTALYFVEFRWKGNFWRDVRELDWRDTPQPVKERLAAVLNTTTDDLDPEHRLIEEGGNSTYRPREQH